MSTIVDNMIVLAADVRKSIVRDRASALFFICSVNNLLTGSYIKKWLKFLVNV